MKLRNTNGRHQAQIVPGVGTVEHKHQFDIDDADLAASLIKSGNFAEVKSGPAANEKE